MRKGAADSIVSMMHLPETDHDLQIDAAKTLSHLGSTPLTAIVIGNSGRIDLLTQSLWLHAQKRNVKIQCCYALDVLSSHSQNLDLMLHIRANKAIVHAMQHTTEDSKIQQLGCSILSNLATFNKSA